MNYRKALYIGIILCIAVSIYRLCTLTTTHLPTGNTSSTMQPVLSDSWYPSSRDELRTMLTTMHTTARATYNETPPSNTLRALIVPHASYYYSGAIATAAYQLIDPQYYQRIILLAPSHHVEFAGILMPTHTEYQLPNGIVPFDNKSMRTLIHNPLFAFDNAHEHAIEIQLPLVHQYAPHAQIIPLLVGNVSQEQLLSIAESLKPLITTKTLIIVSSDMTHYGARFDYTPFNDNQVLHVKSLDNTALQSILAYDPHSFATLIHNTGATICGRTPIAILLTLLSQGMCGTDLHATVVAYGTSKDVSPPSHDDSFVTYASVAFTNSTPLPPSLFEKKELLAYARTTLTGLFDNTHTDTLNLPILTPYLQSHQGAFVTLYKKTPANPKELRGCIGKITSQKPLYKTVADMTRAAALHDSRFEPVTADELPAIRVEVSVLSEPKEVASYKDIVLHKHGIILSVGNASALFLPQVAKEHHFGTVEHTLEQLSIKAGLQPDGWRSRNALLSVFEATIID